MFSNNIVRAWKDPAYRNSLSESERAALPANPAGSIELSDADLMHVAGGFIRYTIYNCPQPTYRLSCDCSTAWPRGLPC
jgi:mersacidin/lichenicidin family type 2 lantibiotic